MASVVVSTGPHVALSSYSPATRSDGATVAENAPLLVAMAVPTVAPLMVRITGEFGVQPAPDTAADCPGSKAGVFRTIRAGTAPTPKLDGPTALTDPAGARDCAPDELE